MKYFFVMAPLALLCACSGGDNGYCVGTPNGGETTFSVATCTGCTVTSVASVADNSSGSFANIHFAAGGGQVTVRATAPGDISFPSGSNPGSLMRFPTGNFTNIGVSFNLYNNGVAVSSNTGGANTTYGQVDKAGTDYFYGGASNPLEFDAVEAVVSLSGNSTAQDVRLYETCGDK